MAAKGKSSVQVEKNLEGFVGILTSAACEWFLIFLLLVDGLFSYLLTKFANYCNLQKPCIFCSRFEHVIGNEKPQLYQDLLCSNHISELSSWIACQIYGNHDGNERCEDCLLSFTKMDKSNPELVGKSGLDFGSSDSKRLLQKRNFVHSSVGVRPCSYCSRPLRPREHSQGLRRRSPSPKPNIPLPRFSSRSRVHHRDGPKKVRAKFSGSVTTRRPRNVGWGSLSPVGDNELKFSSDTDSTRRHGKASWGPLSPVGYKELKFSSDTDSACRPAKGDWDPLSHVRYNELKMSSYTETALRPGKIGWDPLSHVGYTELKISSDTDSEIRFSDDCGSSVIIGNHEPKKEGNVVQFASENPFKAPPNGLDPPKQSNVSYEQKPSVSDPCALADGSKASDVKSFDTTVAFENGLREPNWQHASRTSNPSALPELISLHDILPPSNVVKKNVIGKRDLGHASINQKYELLKAISATDGASVKTDPIINDSGLVKPDHINVDVMSESAGIAKEGDSSVIIKEQPTLEEPDRVNRELKPSDSQNSSAQESNLSSNNTISGVNVCGDEKQVTDTSNSNSKPQLKSSISVESGLESLDEGCASEIEGESTSDRLKRQVDYYRKCIKELFKELDEERNAAAISANQAMAMITKLQEEKAAIHMEALQYLRMMEEQAEFDVDALEKANDLLAEKEKEIQDLEAELEFSKFDIPDELAMENMPDDLKGEIGIVESTAAPFVKNDTEVTCNSSTPVPSVKIDAEVTCNSSTSVKNDAEVTCNSSTDVPSVRNDLEVTCSSSTVGMPSIDNDVEVTCNSMVSEVPKALFSETTLLEFEDEKLYISNCLKSLERKLSEISCSVASSNMPNGGHSRMYTDDGPNQEETPRKKRAVLNGQVEENVVHGQKDVQISNGISAIQEEPIRSDGIDCEEKNDSDFHGRKDHTENDLIILENEVSDLNDRLEALETDHDFLEHMLYSLQNGNEGLRFVQEIAQQLRELRKIGTAFRCQFVPPASNGPSHDAFEI